ncbi:DNA polymerase-3 subunit epsilon [Natronocella acetinitrilica]|uniref:DNA-directed DNA polymerase n=1 Tax=Natronocella acetinitrilica TaxID=414046 RepID=A0AAE3G5G1_9GAMM|nr:exonuclease domain-containing protein [Natronocella acetinitrilica]MCP1674202.1 DNA polymerase-3 subunit epsilon [Natronocella acetinitrilica]
MDFNRPISILDTETTGFLAAPRPGSGDEADRIIELGVVKLPQGRASPAEARTHYQQYTHPEREIPQSAVDVHGLRLGDVIRLSEGRRFVDVVDDFLAFVSGTTLVAHNASFDVSFLNAELARCNKILGEERYGKIDDYVDGVFDSLRYANVCRPGKQNNLNALCLHYSVDTSGREFHGALLDCELLAEVFIRMTGEERRVALSPNAGRERFASRLAPTPLVRPSEAALPVIRASGAERDAHERLMARISQSSESTPGWPSP